MLNQVAKYYDRSHSCINSGNRTFHGAGELTSFILNILAMFPDAGISVDHVYWNGNDDQGYNVAVRWTLTGTHLGYGEYGPPTHARVRIMCLSHHQIKHGVFMQESSLVRRNGLVAADRGAPAGNTLMLEAGSILHMQSRSV